MKLLTLLMCCILLTSCLSSRSTNTVKDKIHYQDRTVIETKSPGDKVFITLPATPNERPKAITNRYNGDKGAKTDVTFDKDGTITSINTDCPEVDIVEQRNIEYERNTKEKQTTREFQFKMAILASFTLIVIGLMFAIAYRYKK